MSEIEWKKYIQQFKQRIRGEKQKEDKLWRAEHEVRIAMMFAGIEDQDIIDGLESFIIGGECYHKDEFYDNAVMYGLSLSSDSIGMVGDYFSIIDPEGQLRWAIEGHSRLQEEFENFSEKFRIDLRVLELRILLNAFPYLKGLGVLKKYDMKSSDKLAKGLRNATDAIEEMKMKMQKFQADDAIFEHAVKSLGKEVPGS